ncbi:unnamed protein product [Hymenolepis diminuta]|uniref:Prospero domain-containing protein n=1 Tax=Hymenolepis diminuta TaxID=6216 RepID=A0A564YPF6_HYMDI|nr:unnamed protein product [Hymenolepis diminuta]
MSALWDVTSIIQSTPTRRFSLESSFGTPSQASSGSCNSFLQFPTSPPEAVFVVPSPSMLLKSPLISQTSRMSFWPSVENWSANSASPEISQIMQISMRQIENRLAQSGIGREKIWRRQQEVGLNDLQEPSNVQNFCISVENNPNFPVDQAQTVRQNSGAKANAPHHEFREDLLNGSHLRKAKLMFLYTRYPNSAYLKFFFPEVKFNRYNTAQLVKWFSNFREYFYINIERYVRTLIAEGVPSSECIRITPKHALYRTLIGHYNRGIENEIPPEFCRVIERTVLEFLIAIISGADSHSAWKKKIYKTIAKFDQPIPEKFRSRHNQF